MSLTRRHFLPLIAGAITFAFVTRVAAVRPNTKLPRIGVILNGGPGPVFEKLRQSFGQLGYVDGRNLLFEPRFAKEHLDRVPALVAELISLNVDVIVAVGIVGARAAHIATTEIPIVFAMVVDPIPVGIVKTLERPSGNITGITSFDPQQPKKQFELLKAVIPKLARVAILSDPDIPHSDADPGWSPIERANDSAARRLGLQPQLLKVKGVEPDLDGVFAAIRKEGATALVILEVPATRRHQVRIAELAAEHRLPTMFPGDWQAAGGLITYGTSIVNTFPRLAEYVHKILKGAKPAEMPIEINTRRRLGFNLRTARAIGLRIPRNLLKRADQITE
ncbi:MAG: ABC transporter substrate-binding protein [Sphingomicrobium sp.]|nr:ABC transporter substrate-binding protein [Sphingomonadales bacterium]